MALNRNKLKNIVGGITSPGPQQTPAHVEPPNPGAVSQAAETPAAGQGSEPVAANEKPAEVGNSGHRRFAQRGRPKGSRDDAPMSKARKVKVSLYLSETLVNDLYEWAHADRVHPGEIFDRALRQFHDREAKRRNAGTE